MDCRTCHNALSAGFWLIRFQSLSMTLELTKDQKIHFTLYPFLRQSSKYIGRWLMAIPCVIARPAWQQFLEYITDDPTSHRFPLYDFESVALNNSDIVQVEERDVSAMVIG